MKKSLEEINGKVSFDSEANDIKKLIMYLGPGLLVAVGYMDQVIGLLQWQEEHNLDIHYYL